MRSGTPLPHLAIAAGANAKVVQTMLGHKSATMTLDLYGHLFADQLDDVADAMDASRTLAQDRADSCGLSRWLLIETWRAGRRR
jgi:hypothetical protein